MNRPVLTRSTSEAGVSTIMRVRPAQANISSYSTGCSRRWNFSPMPAGTQASSRIQCFSLLTNRPVCQ